jgi:hypothetical protein
MCLTLNVQNAGRGQEEQIQGEDGAMIAETQRSHLEHFVLGEP